MTLLLQLRPDGPGNVQSWVVLRLIILSLFSLMEFCIATPNGVMDAPGMSLIVSGSMGIAQ